MIKKLLLVGVIAAGSVFVLKGTKFFGYAKHEMSSLRDWADSQVPVEKKLAALRKEVGGLDKDIDRVKNELAREIVEVRDLAGRTADLRAAVEAEQKGLVARGERLKDATGEKVKNGTVFVSVPEAKDRLKKDVEVHLKKKAALDTYERTLTAREKIKTSLEQQFEQLRVQKRDLLVAIDGVEADYKALQLQQMESKFQTDDTRLARIKEQLRELQKKIDVEKVAHELTPKAETPAPTGPVSSESVDDILAPVTGNKINKAGE